MEDKLEKEILEGTDAETSTAEGELNNSTVPTPEEQENAGIQPDVVASDTIIEEEAQEPPTLTEPPETSATEPMFTQSQVDEIAGKVRKETREKVTKDFFARYGVNTADELDDLFGDAQRFATAREEYDAERKSWEELSASRDQELRDLQESVALLSSGIDKNRYEDAKFILRGKGLDVTVENIQKELDTHPEWKSEQQQQPPFSPEFPFKKDASQSLAQDVQKEPATTIDVLGNDAGPKDNGPQISDYERAMKLFKV